MWHVRYQDPELKHEMASPDQPTRDAALEVAWQLAEQGEEILEIMGPDGETVTMEEINYWFEKKTGVRPDPL